MFMTFDLYLKRIINALENVVAPEIESDHIRGQLFAASNLIFQLTGLAEFKSDLVKSENKQGWETLAKVTPLLEAAGPVPAEVKTYLQDGVAAERAASTDQVDEMLCRVIESFFAQRSKLPADRAREIDSLLRGHLTKMATRDLGLIKPPNIEQISRSKRKK